ncbi:MAG: DEAD/DEAH box helicase [Nanoarchaeota archaeon]
MSDFLKDIIPREYQKKILETCTNKNCLVVIPTGLGKTLIALMLTIERMKKFPGEKVVFLAPTKPLAEQHLNYFKKNLPELFGDMQLFTGSVKPEQRKEIWQTADIIFSTPQCVANDLRKKLYDLRDVCLLIEDEAHRCIKNYDYNYVASNYKEHSVNSRILGLTASPGSESSKIKEICENLSIEAVEVRTRESSDVKQYLQELKFEKIMLELPVDFLKIKDSLLRLFHAYIGELRNRKVLWGPPSKTELIKTQKKIMLSISKGNKNYNMLLASSVCAQAIKIQHALELLETQTLVGFNKYLKELFRKAAAKENKGVIKLVSKPEFNYAFMKSNEMLAKGIEHPKILRVKKLIEKEKKENEKTKIIVFAQFRETASLISKEIGNLHGIKAEVFVGQGGQINSKKPEKSGKVPGMSQKEQKKIIEDFSSGKINVLCATSIGEEGLDIPEVNVVIFYEPVPSAIRAIQRAGRTARLAKGKLIILITKNTRDEMHFYVSRLKERKMHSAINTVKEHLIDKIKIEKQKTLEY